MLTAWRDSPTRLREDAATESDLVRAGYRDRLLTELAQNAADAAAGAGIDGLLSVQLEGRELRIGNTGAPLDRSGVHALTALRASEKPGMPEQPGTGTVGRFGVGFTAVLAVSDDIEVRSTTGSLRFSRTLTRQALDAGAIRVPHVEVGEFAPPVLRLAWPSPARPAADLDTEIVLRLGAEIDAAALLAAMRAEAVDLLLELPALRRIRIGTEEFLSGAEDLGGGLSAVSVDGPGAERRTWWQYRARRARWLLPVRDGRPVAAAADVLRAPTRSDETLSLPALLIADIPMQPDRRRLLPGARLNELADGYADFARALPPRERLVLVPAPGFARSVADALLREALVRELQTHSWLPVVAAAQSVRSDGFDSAELDACLDDTSITTPPARPPGTAIPVHASVFTGLTEEMACLFDEVAGPLVIPDLSGRTQAEAMGVLDVHRLGLARLAELSVGLQRPPTWWREFYTALEPFVLDPLAAEELGALAVPLADGRLVTGPRTVVLDDQLDIPIPVHWARLVHPDAAHPLLARLGARSATVEDLLGDPGLHADLEDHPGDPDTAEAVLRLAAYADPAALPSWLGLLELPDAEGGVLPADQLLLPGAPLRDLLVPDAPFGTVDKDLVDRYGADPLRAVGVGWDFGVLVEADPTGPDHDLHDEEDWWATLPDDPPELAAVRDLDLVDDAAWPEALRHLAVTPRLRRLLADADGYTAWWLRRYARIDGTPLGLFRHPGSTAFAGLLPAFAVAGVDPDAFRAVLAQAGSITHELAAALLEALADPAKVPVPEVVSGTHARLGAAVAAGLLDLAELELPDRVRALSGAVVVAGDAFVLDQPCFGLAVPPDRLVAGDIETASALADLLDVPLISEAVTAEVIGPGRRTTWAAEPLGIVLRLISPQLAPETELVVHRDLLVRLSGAIETTVEVPWWQDGATVHLRAPQVRG
ncbi:sacsin N-terminal ATP-binding-like domain-containing protein [Nocardia sp. 004]|uniref:sacsin N-terminal ATP-binding-like domain-containing protein n=1 Tax=Nocardia sp. 004 TaxID=3385978 RepID=UPI0039A3DADA